MDAAFILVLALVLYIMAESGKFETVEEYNTDDVSEFADSLSEERVAKLNDAFYEDPKAFTEISTVLGFPME